MRKIVRALSSGILRVVLRIFFRRIEIDGAWRIPKRGPVVFVSNHPNGLVDPLFLLCFSPRPVSFLAKEPLFSVGISATENVVWTIRLVPASLNQPFSAE